METILSISVKSTSAAEANRLTSDLESFLRSHIVGVTLKRAKVDSTSMDAGTVLIAMLAAPAVVELARGPAMELAKGISDWLRKRKATISIGADGSVAAENVQPEDVERIITNIFKSKLESGLQNE
ncbi:hypothetical protein [Polaromonas glacialis]|uniref:hypothetical protein n=1 Tax=Polaromonas glacialis TaxID=866564 RepID=UPI0012EC2F1A|nr:hypothetical protein [Polaromonas glacialis]